MSKFFVGQRVRKVRGPLNIGLEGVVVPGEVHPYNAMYGYDFCLRPDGPGVSFSTGRPTPPGAFSVGISSDWEPVLNQKHEACDEEFKRDLDRLLERQGVVA